MVKHRREFTHNRFNPLLGLLIGCLSLSLPAIASEPSGASKSETVLQAARQVVEDTAFATLITIDQAGQPKARTVDAFAPDADWVVWIATRVSSRKVTEITQTPQVTVHYYSDGLRSYVSLMGAASRCLMAGAVQLVAAARWGRRRPGRSRAIEGSPRLCRRPRGPAQMRQPAL